MSNPWLEFDPLAHNKPRAAAPVTSLEQAEVRPAGTSHSREGSLNGLNQSHARKSSQSADLDGNSPNVSPSDKSQAIAHTPTPVSDPATDRDDEGSTLLREGTGRRRSDDEATSGEPATFDKKALTNTSIEPAKNAVEDAVETKDSPSIKQEQEQPSSPKTEAGPSQWPPKLEMSADDSMKAQEPHSGELRKNSIAALKELGDPIMSVKEGQPEEEDVVGSFDFQKFMDSLRTKSATPIAKYIKSFLQEFTRGVWTPTQQEKIIADFHRFIYVKLRDYEPFASMNKRERINSLEGVEKLIMTRLYTRTFSPKMPPILRTDGHNEDLLRDQVFEEKLRLWGWLEGRHLDINEEYLKSSFTQLATSELGRLHQFKSPRDKVICILNCSKVIYALIRQAKLEQNADSFLPLLIYVVLMAHPVHLVSTINYIQRFRFREFQRGETAYYLSTLASAVTFLETLDKASLTITDEEFEQRMADSIRAENNRRTQKQAEEELTNDDNTHPHEGESSAAVLTASAGMLMDRMRKFTTKFIEDITAPDEDSSLSNASEQEPYTDSSPGQRGGSRSGSRYLSQERAAKEASREEYMQEQAQREQFNETLDTLQNMFPTLEKEIIEDVLHENGTNIGSAVDICLALNG